MNEVVKCCLCEAVVEDPDKRYDMDEQLCPECDADVTESKTSPDKETL